MKTNRAKASIPRAPLPTTPGNGGYVTPASPNIPENPPLGSRKLPNTAASGFETKAKRKSPKMSLPSPAPASSHLTHPPNPFTAVAQNGSDGDNNPRSAQSTSARLVNGSLTVDTAASNANAAYRYSTGKRPTAGLEPLDANRLRLGLGSPTSLVGGAILSERRKSHYALLATAANNTDELAEAATAANGAAPAAESVGRTQPVEAAAVPEALRAAPSPAPRRARPLSTATGAASVSSTWASPVVIAIQTLLIDTCNHLSRLTGRLSEGSELLTKVVAVRDAFQAKREDILFFCTTNGGGESPTLGGADQAVVEVLDRALYELQSSLFVLNDQLRKADRFFPPASTKSKRLRSLTDEAWKNWTNLLMHLTLAMSTSSTYVAENASHNVAKLALANGHVDWAALDLDNAQLLLYAGDKFFLGHGVAKSYDLAIKRYEAAAPKCPEACNMLGVMLENGYGRQRDLGEALSWYYKAARQNNGDAWNNLGRIYENGIGCIVDLVRSRSCYEKAALAGCLDGMVNLGLMLEQGCGVATDADKPAPADPEKAAFWYQRAADAGYARAQNSLGSLYYRGLHSTGPTTTVGSPDYERAAELFRKAADQGNPHAQNNLGILYESGLGVPQDVGRAKVYYKEASEQSAHQSATNNYGWVLLLEKSYFEAFRVFHLAASRGSVDAIHNIGLMYEHGCVDASGIVVRKDLELAARYWRQAADQGYTKSIVKCGTLLLGLNLPAEWQFVADPKAGFEYLLHAAAAANSADACYLVGLCYSRALGVEPNAASARKWLSRAMEQNHPEAFYQMGLLALEGDGVERSVERATRFFREAARYGSVQAKARLVELSTSL